MYLFLVLYWFYEVLYCANLKSGFSYSTLEKELPIYNLFMKSSFEILKWNTFFLRKKCFIHMKKKKKKKSFKNAKIIH